jgi:hypothetical protein
MFNKMTKILTASLLLIVSLLLMSCGSKQAQPQVNPLRQAGILYPPVENLPSWAAWLGSPLKGEKIVTRPAKEQLEVIYLTGRDKLLASTGQIPRRPLSVSTQKASQGSANSLIKSLKPRRVVPTALGRAFVQPDGLRAYLVTDGRIIVVGVSDPAEMRPALARLSWLGEEPK